MNRRDFIKNTTLATGGFLLPSISFGADSNHLVILHTNDWHSQIEPFGAHHPKFAGMGGFKARVELVKKIRNLYANVLLLDSGDIFQGTPYFNFYHGELEFKLMSELKYDFATLGNHDFDAGLEGLEKQLKYAEFKFLTANYDFSQTILKDKFEPYTIIERGEFKIGIFGLGIELNGLVPEKLYGHTKYNDPIKTANEIADNLRKKGCNLIVCLSHLGYEYQNSKVSDIVLAKNSSNIDLILGGHTHTFLDQPTEILNKKNKKIFINQVGWAGLIMGRIDYEVNRPKVPSVKGSHTLKII
jgi:5'-nucleotidase